jgi:predicted dehydrogenase
LQSIAKTLSEDIKKIDYPVRKHTQVIERPPSTSSKPSGILFGLGNYAKTAILPNIKGNINLERVHEIDPGQLRFLSGYKNISLDTSAIPRKDLKFDAWFIAGFHHTHSALAISALEQGAYAVIEKPLVTSMDQYKELLRSIEINKNSRFYSCFHKRYSKLNNFFHRDMDGNENYSVDMHCIVYEIPLPTNHWYNWTKSGSRLISNGCHWLDYFMFLNNYSEVIDLKKWNPRDSDMVVQVSLANGAYLSMSLTDSGSQRLGVRDYIELRAAGNTFTMIDGTYYTAENRNHVYAKHRVNPMTSYSKMYADISSGIANKDAGDDTITLRSTKLMLDLEYLS